MSRKKAVRRQRTKAGEIPQILHRKDRNLAFILIEGHRVYLGPYGSIEAEENRLRVWNEYKTKKGLDPNEIDDAPVTVATLVNRFLVDAKTVYVKHGRSTGSYERFVVTARPLFQMYADNPVVSFTPGCLKAVREVFIDQGMGRKTINGRIDLLRQIFQWGVENELVEETTWRALTAVKHLKEGKTKAPDYPDVEPVPDEIVDATIPFMPAAIADMVRIQQMIGARPSEICNIRACDIHREGDVFPKKYAYLKKGLNGIWVYIPSEYKMEHKKKERWLPLGPKCQEIIHSYLGMEPDWKSEDYVFSPEAEQKLRSAMSRAKRKTKVQPSQRNRRKVEAKRKPGKKYRVDSYRTAIQRSVGRFNDSRILAWAKEQNPPPEFSKDKQLLAWAKEQISIRKIDAEELGLIPKWFPYQIRHNVATETRAAGEIETAQVLLGHSNLKTTELYAKKNKELAIQFALKNC